MPNLCFGTVSTIMHYNTLQACYFQVVTVLLNALLIILFCKHRKEIVPVFNIHSTEILPVILYFLIMLLNCGGL